MSEEFFDSKRYETNIVDSRLNDFLDDKDFVKEQIGKVMTMLGGEVSPLTLIRGLRYWLGENQEVTEALERLYPSNTIRRKCLLHYYAICVYAMAIRFRLLGGMSDE